MNARPCLFELRRAPAHGYTLVELVTVLLLVGILSAVALPRLRDIGGLRGQAFHDDVLATMRLAQKLAVSHRRLVCATVSASSINLNIASANPATTCDGPNLSGPDGNTAYAHSSDPSRWSLSVTPASTPNVLYFQPDGGVSRDGAGSSISDFTLIVTSLPAITVYGRTGHAE